MLPSTAINGPFFRVPAIFASIHTVVAAESTRHGGVSQWPFASLNLGINTADDPAHVDENRRRFFDALGVDPDRFASSHQVHGTEVLTVTGPGRYEGYDALITNEPNTFLGVTVADCVPILVYDQENQAVAAIHAGWRGTVGGIVAKTLAAMQTAFGTKGSTCYAYVGTCIDETAFEVGPEVAEQFAAEFKRIDPYTEKIYINLKSANTKPLVDFGIPTAQISISTFSTVLNNDDYYSFRAEKGQTGRMLAVIGLRS